MPPSPITVVVIGRNEGERLRRCLDTLLTQTGNIVYVDSGSTDGSREMAASRGVRLVDLDMRKPFSAARARNEGFGVLQSEFPATAYVQFVDGDCEVHTDWLQAGRELLDARGDVTAVYGMLAERHPERSVYNLHGHLTWNPGGEGEVDGFGGNIMVRVSAMAAVGGFNEAMIDSEDLDMAIRLKAQGGKVWYLQRPMAIHDLAIERLTQWWKRGTRNGYGNGHIVALHGDKPGRPRRRDWLRIWIWGLALPLVVVAGTLLWGPLGLLPLGLYAASFARMLTRPEAQGGRNIKLAGLMILAKFAEALGQLRFLRDRIAGKRARLMEYK